MSVKSLGLCFITFNCPIVVPTSARVEVTVLTTALEHNRQVLSATFGCTNAGWLLLEPEEPQVIAVED